MADEIDPVSGNEIPLGSEPNEVRDDIDAKLSEGEYVVPADVVKFFGVNFFEQLRTKAKSGFEEMDKEGRIGGSPADVAQEVVEEMSDDDVISTATAEFAEGGVVTATPDISKLLDNAKLRASRDPEFAQMLKAKGISIQEAPQGSASPSGNMNTPVQMNEGGFVDPSGYTSSFDPAAHQLGFSLGAPSTPPTGIDSSAQCGPGTVWDAKQGMCVLEQQPVTPQVSEGSTDQGEAAHTPQTKTEGAWMNRYDYTNPEKLSEQTMTTLGGSGGGLGALGDLIGNFLPGAGAAGKAVGSLLNSQKYSEAIANSEVLRAQGHTEQADLIKAQADEFAENNNVRRDSLLDSSKRLTKEALAKQATSSARPTTPESNSNNEDNTNIGNYRGDRDNDGVPNWRDFDDGVGWADKNKDKNKK